MNFKPLLDRIDDLETIAVNKIHKTCDEDSVFAATRAIEELVTGLRRTIRTSIITENKTDISI